MIKKATISLVLKRLLICTILVVFYFLGWSEVRSLVTKVTVLPQIDRAIEQCDSRIHYQLTRNTSLYLFVINDEQSEYEQFGYITPGGFYFLFGLIVIVLLGGNIFHYSLLTGYHFGFWVVTILLITPGLCIHSVFLHVTSLGIRYLTPFVTFLILILLISPALSKKIKLQ